MPLLRFFSRGPLCAGIVAAALALCGSDRPALSQTPTGSPKPLRALHVRLTAPLGHQVAVADQLVMVIDVPANGRTAAERVDTINDRLVEIISTEPLLPGHMHLATQHGQTVIVVGRHLLTSVTPADARANKTTVATLAHFWLANLKRALPQARPAAALP